MNKSSVSATKKKIGRPATGVGTPVQVRLAPDDLAAIDGFRDTEADKPSRPEAIRRLIERGLSTLPLSVVVKIWKE